MKKIASVCVHYRAERGDTFYRNADGEEIVGGKNKIGNYFKYVALTSKNGNLVVVTEEEFEKVKIALDGCQK